MTSQPVVLPPSRLEQLPLEALRLSDTPAQIARRATFIDTELDELAASLRIGQAQPILVRPLATTDTYEVVAGERRVLAARRGGLPTLDATIRELTDRQVLELQLVENLRRHDLTPLVEAESYHHLLEHGHTVESLAELLGKSRGFVFARLKLRALVPDARTAVAEGKIATATAIPLARLPATLQHDALRRLLTPDWRDQLPSTREAVGILQALMRHLTAAPFDPADAELVADAGPCITCPHRIAADSPEASPGQKSDLCCEPTCFGRKVAADRAQKLADFERRGLALLSPSETRQAFAWSSRDDPKGFLRVDRPVPGTKVLVRTLLKGQDVATVAALPEGADTPLELVPLATALELARERGDVNVRELEFRIRSEKSGAQIRERERRDRSDARTRRKYNTALYDAVTRTSPLVASLPPALRPLLELLATTQLRDIWHDRRKWVFARWGWNESLRWDDGPGLAHLIAPLADEQLLTLLGDIAVSMDFSSQIPRERCDRLEALVDLRGLDRKAFDAEYFAAEAPPRSTKAAAKAKTAKKAAAA